MTWLRTPVTLTQYQSNPVWLIPPNRREALSADWLRDLNVQDSDTGVFEVFDQSGQQRIRQSATWTFISKTDVREFTGFLSEIAGKVTPFWAVMFSKDMVLAAPVSNGAQSITVSWIGYTDNFDNNGYPASIYLKLNDGSEFFLTVNASVDNGADETISFDETIGQDVAIADVKMLSFLHLVRLNHDSVEFSHIAPEIMECQLTLETIKTP